MTHATEPLKMDTIAESGRENRLSVLKKFGSWMAAALILGYLFFRIDFETFYQSIRMAELHVYLPLIIGFVFVWFLIESQNIMVVCKHLGHTLSYHQSLDIRGVTYLLMIINPFVGLGGIAFYLKKELGIPLVRASSVMIFYSYTEMMCLLVFVAAGSTIIPDPPLLFRQMYYMSIGFIIFYTSLITISRRLPARGMFKKVTDSQIWGTFFEAKTRSFIILPLWRSIYFISFVFFFHFGLKAFQIDIPLIRLFVYVPLIFWIGCWPITPFGLGTIQASMLYFFREYSSEANILAFSISYSTLLLIFRVPIGLYYLRKYNSLKKR